MLANDYITFDNTNDESVKPKLHDLRICKHTFAALHRIKAYGWGKLEEHAKNRTKPVNGTKGKVSTVTLNFRNKRIPALNFFEKNILFKFGPRPMVLVRFLVESGTLDSDDVVNITNRDGSRVLENSILYPQKNSL